MMYQDNEELHKAASWPGVKGGGRERLMDELQGSCGSYESSYSFTYDKDIE